MLTIALLAKSSWTILKYPFHDAFIIGVFSVYSFKLQFDTMPREYTQYSMR